MSGIDPSFGQLRAFVVVAEELHFGRAAARLHMTQPPLSRMIRSLERAVGVQLFERTSRAVTLTPAGSAFLAEVRGILTQLMRAREAADEVAHGGRRTWRVGYVESAGFRVLPRVLAQVRTALPSTSIELHELHTLAQTSGLRDRTLDFGIMRATAAQESELEIEYAYDDHVVLALPDHHPVQGQRINLAELAHEPFIAYDMRLGGGLFAALLKAATTAGFTPRVVQRANSTPMLMTLVAAGEGVALVAEPISMVPRPGVRFAEIADAKASAQVVCGWRRGETNPIFGALLQMVRQNGSTK